MSPIFIGVLNTPETRNSVKILIKYCLVDIQPWIIESEEYLE